MVKKVNNNMAIRRDGSQRELVALGKGTGFPPVPYELTDLSKIDRSYILLPAEIPPETVQFIADQILALPDGLPYEASSNLALTLADHIALAIERAGRSIYVQTLSIYDGDELPRRGQSWKADGGRPPAEFEDQAAKRWVVCPAL